MGIKEWNARRKLRSAGFETYGGPTTSEKARTFGTKVLSGTKSAFQSANATRERIAKSEGYKKFNTWADNAAANFQKEQKKGPWKKKNNNSLGFGGW